jgi:PAS domain S-box-containing protein
MNAWNEPPATTLGAVMAVCDQLFSIHDRDELCQCTVQSVRSEIGLDRASIWLANHQTQTLHGTFGIDEQGRLRDERDQTIDWNILEIPPAPGNVQPLYLQLKKETEASGQPSYRHFFGPVGNHARNQVGEAERLVAAIWDGTHTIGTLSCDNLLRQKPILPAQVETLRLIAMILGQLLSRNQSEQELDRQRTLLSNIAESLPDAVTVLDKNRRYLFANRSKFEIAPYKSLKDIIGKQPSDFYSPELCSKFYPYHQRVLDSGEPLHECAESMQTTAKGQRIFVESIAPLKNRNLETDGVIVIQRDVTETRHAQQALHREQELLTTFLTHIPDYIFFKDRQHRFVRVSQALVRGLGLDSEKDILGKTDEDVFAPAHADKTRAHEEAIMTTGVPLIAQTEHEVWKDGSETWSSTTKMPWRDPEGRVIGIFGIARNITALKTAEKAIADSEALFHSVWKNSIDAMRLTDSEGRILAVNPAFCRLFRTEESEVLGKTIEHVYADEDKKDALQSYLDRFTKAPDPNPIRMRRILPGGHAIDLEVTYSKFTLSNSQVRFLSVIRDAAQIVRQETERLELEKRFLASQRMESLGIMAGGVAHDFNNMLTGILGNTSLAQMNLPDGSPVREDLQRVEQICFQAAELCQQLLAYSGRGRFEVKTVSLNTLIRDMHHLLEISIHKSIFLQLDLHEDLPSTDLDVPQIRQLLLNLVINASEAIGGNHEGTIRISTQAIHADAAMFEDFIGADSMAAGSFIQLEVTDTGSGIQPADLPHIFDPFFTTKFTGRGLGLAAVLGIVRGHGGALRVKSSPNDGTTFTFLLPPGSSKTVLPTTAHAVTAEASPSVKPARLLVVDDEPTIRSLAGKILTRLGHQVSVAASGKEAIERFKNDPSSIDCVLLDLTMPLMSGHEVMEALRVIDPQLPILIMSGYSEADIARKFHGISPTGFIQKPFNATELTQRIESCLALRSPDHPPAASR